MNENNTNLQETKENTADCCIENTCGEEKCFTQEQLEKIVGERLMRERKTTEALLPIKKMLTEFKEKGLLSGKSFADMATELSEILSKNKQQPTVEENTPHENEEESDAEFCAEDKAEGDDDAIGESDEKNEKDEGFFETISLIKQKYGDQGVLMLGKDLFSKFAKGRKGGTGEIFDDFMVFMSSFDEEKEADDTSHCDPYGATSFSGFSENQTSESGLTKKQMEMAKSEGITYREYANMLKSINTKNKN